MANEDTKKRIKDSIDIVALIGETVPLRRAGKLFRGLSPFAKEKSPSFFVNPEKQTFYCYSTNQGGDSIDFLRLVKGYSYIEALKALGEKAGIALDLENKTPEQIAKDRQEQEARKLLLKINRFAAHFYQEQFNAPVGAVAREYAQKRAITQDALLNFGIGFAPDAWTALRDYLLKIKAPMLNAHELGLLRTKGGEAPKADGSNLFDTFRNRLIFPIRDPQGEVIAFGGRWLGSESTDAPKYLNSPESPVYHKSRTLYNLDRARKAARDLETIVLVEGYMDCLALDQAGFPNVVANCGTALTEQHARILRQLVPRVVCLYDSDAAGLKATERNMEIFLEAEGFPLLATHVPNGKDPDDFLRAGGASGAAAMADLLKNAPAEIDAWIDRVLAATPPTVQARAAAIDKIASKLALLRDELWIQARLGNLAQRLEMDGALVDRAIQRHRKNFQGLAKPATSPVKAQNVPVKSAPITQKSKAFQGKNGRKGFGFERKFLMELLAYPEWLPALRRIHERDPLLVLPHVEDQEIKSALAFMLTPLQAGESEESRLQKLQDEMRSVESVRNIVAEAVTKNDSGLPAKELEAALEKLREESQRKQVDTLKERIRAAELSGDSAESERLMQQLQELRRPRMSS